MRNFTYSIPTIVHFGHGQVAALPQEILKYGTKVLLVYGGGSIKQNGAYQAVTQALSAANIQIVELSGVEPNPRIESVRQGAAICKEQGIDVVLPVGGGSTIDCAKVIAAAAKYDGDAWDLVKTHGSDIVDALPLMTVLTLSATGSEMDAGAVISDLSIPAKLATINPAMLPKASILDPTYTQSVSPYQTASGTADIFSHILEVYFTTESGYMQDRLCEALLKTLIACGPIALADPANYEARANLMWASSWAINGFLSNGREMGWSVHMIEHTVSAHYDITHGAGLAVLTPPWMRFVLDAQSLQKFVEYGTNVWGIDAALPPQEIAEKAIQATKYFFTDTLKLPANLRECGVPDQIRFDQMADETLTTCANPYRTLTHDAIVQIYNQAY